MYIVRHAHSRIDQAALETEAGIGMTCAGWGTAWSVGASQASV